MPSNTQANVKINVNVQKAIANVQAMDESIGKLNKSLTGLKTRLTTLTKPQIEGLRLLNRETDLKIAREKRLTANAQVRLSLQNVELTNEKTLLKNAELQLRKEDQKLAAIRRQNAALAEQARLDLLNRREFLRANRNPVDASVRRGTGVGGFASAGRFNGLSDIGFAGLGVGLAFNALIKPAAELEKTIDIIKANRTEFENDPDFQSRILASIRQFTVDDKTVGRASPISQAEFAEGFLKIVKDGIGISPELQKSIENNESLTENQRAIGTTENFIGKLAQITSNIARAAGEPESFTELADIIGELVPKNITSQEQLFKTAESLSKFEKVVVGTLSNTRFDVGNLTKAIRNTIGVQDVTSLPIDEIFRLMTALDRVAPTGRSSGTSGRRFFQELVPTSKTDFDILKFAGIDPKIFKKQVSNLKTGQEVVDFVEKFKKKLEEVSGSRADAASLATRFFGTEADKAFRGISGVGKNSFAESQRKIDEINIGDRIRLIEGNLINAIEGFKNDFTNLTTTLGIEGGLLKDLTEFFDTIAVGMRNIALSIRENPAMSQLIVTFVKLGAVILPLIILINGFAFVLEKVKGTLALTVGRYAALALLVNHLTQGIPLDLLVLAFNTFAEIFDAAAEGVQWLDQFVDSLGKVGEVIKLVIGTILGAVLSRKLLRSLTAGLSFSVGNLGLTKNAKPSIGANVSGAVAGAVGGLSSRLSSGFLGKIFSLGKVIIGLFNPFKKVGFVLSLLASAAIGAATKMNLISAPKNLKKENETPSAERLVDQRRKFFQALSSSNPKIDQVSQGGLLRHAYLPAFIRDRAQRNGIDFPELRSSINDFRRTGEIDKLMERSLAIFPELANVIKEPLENRARGHRLDSLANEFLTSQQLLELEENRKETNRLLRAIEEKISATP